MNNLFNVTEVVHRRICVAFSFSSCQSFGIQKWKICSKGFAIEMYWGPISSLAYSTRGAPVTQTKTTIFDYGLRKFSVIRIRYLVSGLSRTVLTTSNPLVPLVPNPHDTGYKTFRKHLSKIVLIMTLVLYHSL